LLLDFHEFYFGQKPELSKDEIKTLFNGTKGKMGFIGMLR